MTHEEIDKWVEDHISVPPEEELTEHTTVVYPKLIPALIEWGKNIAHKFYEIGYVAGYEFHDRKKKD